VEPGEALNEEQIIIAFTVVGDDCCVLRRAGGA